MIYHHIQSVIDSMGSMNTSPGVDFDHHRIIDRVKAYRANQYLERADDAIFWDLGTHRATHFAKNIDLDTKDLQPEGQGQTSFVQIFILKMKLYRWLEDNRFALRLNELAEELADFGSAVVKLRTVEGKQVVDICDLSSLRFDPLTKNLRETDIVEIHQMSWDELQDKKDVWNLSHITKQEEEYEVREFWGYYDNKYVQSFTVKGYDTPVFYEERKEKECPYFDFHISGYRGRWLRRGVYERLFGLYERANRLVNKNAETQEIASLLLMRTSNPDMDGNVLTQAESGQIIGSDDLQQIAIDNRAINSFINEMQMIENQADKVAFTPEVITGGDLPSNTPFRSVATISSAAKSTFKMIRQYYGEQLGYFLKEQIFPNLVKDWNSKELYEIARSDEDVRIYDQQLRKLTKWKTFVNNLLEGKIVAKSDLESIDQEFEEKIENKVRRITIPKGFFNFKYQIRTNITGEQTNKQAQNDAYFNALQMVQTNPQITNLPLFRQYVENNGINHWRLTARQAQELQQAQGAKKSEAIGTGEDKLLAAADAE